jgi:hypothetical protein
VRRFEPALSLWAYHWVVGDVKRAGELLPGVQQLAVASGDALELARAHYLQCITYAITQMVDIGTAPEDGIRDAEASGVPFQLANAYTGKLAVEQQRDRSLVHELFARARRWSQLAGTRMLFDNAASWMANGSREAEPLDALAYARMCMGDTYESRYWGNFEIVLRPVVEALARLGRHRSAALLLGGLLALPGTRGESAEIAAVAEPLIRAGLGDAANDLLADGARLDRPGLARIALAEIDELLPSSG